MFTHRLYKQFIFFYKYNTIQTVEKYTSITMVFFHLSLQQIVRLKEGGGSLHRQHVFIVINNTSKQRNI